jgi:hypothetical protein
VVIREDEEDVARGGGGGGVEQHYEQRGQPGASQAVKEGVHEEGMNRRSTPRQ